MRLLSSLIGVGLILLGIYFLGKNIFFTTQVYPYWWRGIAADASILALTSGIVGLFALPRGSKSLGWVAIALGILLIFFSSRAVLSPTSLWHFLIALAAMVGGYQLLTTGRLNL
jgi:hypothetical protein